MNAAAVGTNWTTPMARPFTKTGPHYDQATPLVKRRKQLGLNQTELAVRYGSKQGYISDVERGHVDFSSAGKTFFEKMARALEWSVEELMNALGVPYVLATGGNGEAREGPPAQEVRVAALSLRSARAGAQISPDEAAVRSGIDAGTLSRIEAGEQSLLEVPTGALAKLHKAFGLSWSEFLAVIVPVYGDWLPHLRAQSESGVGKPVEFDMQPAAVRQIRYGGVVGAGYNPMAVPTDHSEMIKIPEFPGIENYDDDDLMVLRVSGDSMCCEEARLTIPEGSIAVFHVGLEPQPGDVVAAWLEREGVGVLKIYQPSPANHLILESYNKRHMPIILTEENPGTLQGVYVGHIASGRRAHNRRPPLSRN